jgi:hypothetical protein
MAGLGQTWYTAQDPKGPWAVTTKTPTAIKDFVKPDPDAEPQTGPPPQIITATVPTELIVTSGPLNWAPVSGNQLLYVNNTESTMLKEISTNDYYVLLSGRWFKSRSLDGPWTYVRGDQVPGDFKQIPPASPVGDALTAVAGTNRAEDAEMDADIPQTAAIKRNEASTDVSYDGAPQFQQIPSTQVEYAVNTGSSVLKIGDRYYVCDNGVWFAGVTPTGPWAVADSVPDAVQTIPPSAPVYNVRYVRIYDVTPDIVYVGYTPGYIGTYRYYGTVVYGTGWYYRPWIGPVYYYPRPYTWGFNVLYNPWSGGWGFALGYSTPFINVSIGWRSSYYRYPPYWGGGGWWGPGGYRPIYRPLPGYRPPYRPPRNVMRIQPIGRPGKPGYGPGNPNRPGKPGRPGRPSPYTRDNLYARPGRENRVKTDYRPGGKTPKPNKRLPNNVYTDKNGDVYRRNTSGKWDKRENGKWTKPAPSSPSTQPVNNPGGRPGNRPERQPKPGRPSTQPAPNQPSTRPSRPERPAPQPRPSRPSNPSNPSIQPAPNPNQPGTRPSQPSTRPSTRLSQPSTQPTIQPAPSPGLDRDADARKRSRTSRKANTQPRPTQDRSQGGGRQQQQQPKQQQQQRSNSRYQSQGNQQRGGGGQSGGQRQLRQQ